MMGFMSVASMSHNSVMIMIYMPVFIHGYLTCGKIIENPTGVAAPFTTLLMAPIAKLMNYGNANRASLITMRADLEVYTGFYIIIGWFFGMTQLIQIMLYWQCTRVRAMLNVQTKLAFIRFDEMIQQNVLNRLPAIAHKPYNFIKTFMVSMGSPPQPPSAESLENPNLASMMAQSFRRCTIF